MKLKKLILNIVEPDLSKLGYQYDKGSGQGTYLFTKNVDGYEYGLEITKHRFANELIVRLILPIDYCYNIFYITDGVMKDMLYSNDDELKECLYEIRDQFVNKTDKWIRENSIERFDVYEIYNKIADAFFKNYNYIRTHTDENLLIGGQVIYSNNDSKIIFGHSKGRAVFGCRFINNEVEQNIRWLMGQKYKATGNEENQPSPCYRNREDYVNRLNAYLYYLKTDFFPNQHS